jgi:hypothetical protein
VIVGQSLTLFSEGMSILIFILSVGSFAYYFLGFVRAWRME